jgi:prepilin-type N-terminal cleavage/methylation domain-containing protein
MAGMLEYHQTASRRGFSLSELSVVLLVFGFSLVFGWYMMGIFA